MKAHSTTHKLSDIPRFKFENVGTNIKEITTEDFVNQHSNRQQFLHQEWNCFATNQANDSISTKQ